MFILFTTKTTMNGTPGETFTFIKIMRIYKSSLPAAVITEKLSASQKHALAHTDEKCCC
jgi:hypothetical protein